MKGIILGNNISGLIWKFYYPDYEVIAPVYGVSVKNQYANSNMVWLHDTYETRKLLEDLGWQDVQKKARRAHIGYWNSGWISEDLTSEMSESLIQKKMTPWDVPVNKIEVKDNKMSMTHEDSVPFMNVLSVDTADILRALQKVTSTTHGHCVSISNSLVGISDMPKDKDNGVIYSKYDKLVSTIPAHIFWKLWDTPLETTPDFKFQAITSVILKDRPPAYDDRYDMIYYNEEFRWTRASYLNGKYGLEFTGTMSKEDFETLYPNLEIEDIFVNPAGRISSGDFINTPPTDNIIFSGRFAQWDYKITTEHVVQQALSNLNI